METIKPSSSLGCGAQGWEAVGTTQLVIWGEIATGCVGRRIFLVRVRCCTGGGAPGGAAASPAQSPTSMSTCPRSLELSSAFSRRSGRMTPKVFLS